MLYNRQEELSRSWRPAMDQFLRAVPKINFPDILFSIFHFNLCDTSHFCASTQYHRGLKLAINPKSSKALVPNWHLFKVAVIRQHTHGGVIDVGMAMKYDTHIRRSIHMSILSISITLKWVQTWAVAQHNKGIISHSLFLFWPSIFDTIYQIVMNIGYIWTSWKV